MMNKKMVNNMIEWEHPEDRKDRLESEALAIKHIDAFIIKYDLLIKSLIQTYSDEKASKLLQDLREQFWANLPAE